MLLLVCGPPATGDVPAPQGRATANHPPVLMFNIPLQTFLEDNPGNIGYHLVNLSKYFADDGGVENLTYNVVMETDPTHIHAIVDGQFLSFTTPTRYWYGQERFRVRATDADGLGTESNAFTVRVSPIDDRINIGILPEIELTAEMVWFFNLSRYITYQNDGHEDLDKELLRVATNSSHARAEGLLIYFKYPRGAPNSSYAETVFLNVSDSSDYAWAVLTVIVWPPGWWMGLPPTPWEILMIEGAPYTHELPLVVVGNETPLRKLAWNVTGVSAGDPPLFSAGLNENRTMLLVQSLNGLGRGNFTLNACLSGQIIYSYNVSVGIRPQDLFHFVKIPKDMTVREDEDVSFMLVRDYPWERLNFWTNTSLFTIPKNGWVHFTPGQKDVGEWTIFLCVTVKGYESEYENGKFKLTVLNVNDPPENAVITRPADHKLAVEGQSIYFEANATDVDGDLLNYTWHSDGKPFAGGKSLRSSALSPGTHRIHVNVSDGEYSITSQTIQLTVEPASSVEGRSISLTFMFLLGALAIGTGALLLLRKKRPWRPHAYR